jgi:hypothetical protein
VRREQAYAAFVRLLLDTVSGSSGSQAPDAITEHRRELAALIVVAGITEAAISWLQGDVDLRRESVVDEIARMIITAVGPALSTSPRWPTSSAYREQQVGSYPRSTRRPDAVTGPRPVRNLLLGPALPMPAFRFQAPSDRLAGDDRLVGPQLHHAKV